MFAFKLSTPVAFFIFNRPETTQQVFNEIRKAQPPKLLIIADGPREEHPEDIVKCANTRAIIEQIDWECEVHKQYFATNLGCKHCVSTGLDWVFSTVEEAIILEHDCLPQTTFFQYCQDLLEKYRNDSRVFAISGCNFLFGNRRTDYSYYFSRRPHFWGWASWRRSWSLYDVNISLWPEVKNGRWLYDILHNKEYVECWQKIFDATYFGYIDTWDYQGVFACWIQNALIILPNTNLISNIGFGPEATHTKNITCTANMPTVVMNFPLKHPKFMICDNIADEFTKNLII